MLTGKRGGSPTDDQACIHLPMGRFEIRVSVLAESAIFMIYHSKDFQVTFRCTKWNNRVDFYLHLWKRKDHPKRRLKVINWKLSNKSSFIENHIFINLSLDWLVSFKFWVKKNIFFIFHLIKCDSIQNNHSNKILIWFFNLLKNE